MKRPGSLKVFLPRPSPLVYVALAFAALLYLPSLAWTLGHDQNVFAEIGHLLLGGKRLYVDAWDIKPPNIHYTYALAEALFGDSELGIRLADYCSFLLSLILVGGVVNASAHRGGFDDRWISISTSLGLVLFAAVYLSLGLADTAQTESFALPCLLLALACLVHLPESRRAALAAGASLAIATFFKTTNIVFLVPMLLQYVVRVKSGAGRIGLLSMGFAVVSSLELLSLSLQGSLGEYLRILWKVAVNHPSESGAGSATAFDVVRILWVYFDFWLLAAIGGIALILRQREWKLMKELRSPLTFLVAGAIAVMLQRKGWGYHYVILLPGLTPVVALGGARFLRWLFPRIESSPAMNYALLVAITIGLTFVSPSGKRRYRYLHSSYLSIADHDRYLAMNGVRGGMYYPPCTVSLAEALENRTGVDETIFIFGHEPGAYWRSGREPASRYLYTLLFATPVVDLADADSLVADLRRSRPRVIAVQQFDTLRLTGVAQTSWDLVHSAKFKGFKQFLDSGYQYDASVCNKFILYTRRT